MPLKSISEWENEDSVSLNEFFLSEQEFPGMYWQAKSRYEKQLAKMNSGEAVSTKPDLPVEQLSPKGLAIISYLYALKDRSERQPVIASTVGALHHLIKLVDDAPTGTTITTIFQPTDTDPLGYYEKFYSKVHKTVLKIEKTQTGIQIIHMDGANSLMIGYVCKLEAVKALNENANNKNRSASKMIFLTMRLSDDKPFPKEDNESRYELDLRTIGYNDAIGKTGTARQSDQYQCGIYATKDARQLNRDRIFTDDIREEYSRNKNVELWTYVLPAKYQKSIQSRYRFNPVLEKHGDKVVTRKNKTLKETYIKHAKHGYLHDFSQKYRNAVIKFVQSHESSFIKAAAEKYDAGKMTASKLASVYGPQCNEQAEVKQKSEGENPVPKTNNYSSMYQRPEVDVGDLQRENLTSPSSDSTIEESEVKPEEHAVTLHTKTDENEEVENNSYRPRSGSK